MGWRTLRAQLDPQVNLLLELPANASRRRSKGRQDRRSRDQSVGAR